MNSSFKKKWYPIYTRARAEKKVNQQLIQKGIESYLPLQKTLKQWSDRKKWVQEPLFRSYVFVHLTETEFIDVLKINGVAGFISFEQKRASIPDNQIEIIRKIENNDINFEVSTEDFEIGDTVEIQSGALKNLRGALIELRGKYKVFVKIEAINQAILIDIPVAHLKKVA